MWEIVSFGNVETLRTVFNSISVIFSDGGYKAAASALALLVVLGSTLGSLASGKPELPYNRILAVIIIYCFGFLTLTNVSIENRYTGEVTQIDNIPTAIAVPASLISQIGLLLAEKTETAFNQTDGQRITTNGYMSPLKKVVSLGRASILNCPAGALNSTVNGIKLCESMKLYVADCTMVNATRTNSVIGLREQDAVDALGFNSQAYSTKIIKNDNTEETVSCSKGFDLISGALTDNGLDQMINAISDYNSLRADETGAIQTVDAFQALGIDSGRSRAMLRALFIKKSMEDGALSFYYKMGATDIAENLNSSIDQRNYTWTLQGELWMEIVDKFLDIVEALIYTLAPFIGLMVLTGSVGSKTMLLYLQMLSIIQLMPTLLVIVQAIIMKDIQEYQQALVGNMGLQEGSIKFMEMYLIKVKESMGLGGMMAATVVPALSMALITGSGMALMGAFRQVGAPPKDVDAVPNLADQGKSIVNLGGLNTGKMDQNFNAMTDRTLASVWKVGQSGELSNAIAAAKTESLTRQEAYSNALANAKSVMSSTDYTSAVQHSLGRQIQTGLQENDNWKEAFSNSQAYMKTLTKEQSERVSNAVAIGLMMKGSGASFSLENAKLESQAEKDAFTAIMSGERGEGLTATYNDARTNGKINTETLTTGVSSVDSAIRTLTLRHSEMEEAQKTYSQLSQLRESLKVSNDDLPTQMHKYAQDEGVQRALSDAVLNLSDSDLALYAKLKEENEGGANGNMMDSKTAGLMAYSAVTMKAGNEGDFISVIQHAANNFEYGNVSNQAPENTVNLGDKFNGRMERQVLNEPNINIPTLSSSIDFTSEEIEGMREYYTNYQNEVTQSQNTSDTAQMLNARYEEQQQEMKERERQKALANTLEKFNVANGSTLNQLVHIDQFGTQRYMSPEESKELAVKAYNTTGVNIMPYWMTELDGKLIDPYELKEENEKIKQAEEKQNTKE